MTKEQLTTAYNIAIKYGFCGDCRRVHDSDKCHKYDCYVNAVSVIQEAIQKAYKSEKPDLTFEDKCTLKALGSGYLARDSYGTLYMYECRPYWNDVYGHYHSDALEKMPIPINKKVFQVYQ